MVSRTRKNNKRRRNGKRSRRVQKGGKLAVGVEIPEDFPKELKDILEEASETYDQYYINETSRNLGTTLDQKTVDADAESKFKKLEGEQKFKRLLSDTVEPYNGLVDKSCVEQLAEMRQMGKESFKKLIKDLEEIRTYLRNRKGHDEVTKYITVTINKLSIMKYREGDDKKYRWQKKGFFDNHYEMEPYECRMLKEGLERLSLIPHKIAELYKTGVDADADEVLTEILEREILEQQDRDVDKKRITDRYNKLVNEISTSNTGGAKKSRKRRKTTRRKTTRRKPKRTNRRKLKSKKR